MNSTLTGEGPVMGVKKGMSHENKSSGRTDSEPPCLHMLSSNISSFIHLYDNTRRNLKQRWGILATENLLTVRGKLGSVKSPVTLGVTGAAQLSSLEKDLALTGLP